ncbi:SDR family NAD(P)-dependent oxidoreductase [Pedobacter lithocola]|uniref:SDR family NAD(P)-dependent oxidoreductase n=1 Tax=Pedobacter lithocola TaxID=1908239 RepID=A0ABV8P5V8_9SPHI
MIHVAAVQLEVIDEDSVKTAREEIGRKTEVLDVLINNEGVRGGIPYHTLEAGMDKFLETFDANVFGVASVAQGFMNY